jgi:hypothetical protein
MYNQSSLTPKSSKNSSKYVILTFFSFSLFSQRGPESLHYPNSEGDTPIFLACFDQHHDALTHLLKNNALTNSVNGNFSRAFLISQKASGFLPLQIAARRGAVKCAETLISHGAEIRTYREEDVKRPKVVKVVEKEKPRKSKASLKKITVKTPDKKIKIHVDFSWKVSEVILMIQQKVPGLVGYKLFLDSIELDPVHPLSNYPKLAETKVGTYF